MHAYRKDTIIKCAGVKAGPRLFQNLRATRQTELAAEHPLHVVCQWIGNSEPIAAKHYLQMTEGDFEAATRGDAESGAALMQRAGAATQGNDRQPRSQESEKAPKTGAFLQVITWPCYSLPFGEVPPRGVEPLFSD